jgi:hypothetical protein
MGYGMNNFLRWMRGSGSWADLGKQDSLVKLTFQLLMTLKRITKTKKVRKKERKKERKRREQQQEDENK